MGKKPHLTGTLGERIRSLLDAQGKSVTWLAEEIGLQRPQASRIVNGHSPDPHLSTLKKIAAALGVSVCDLIDE